MCAHFIKAREHMLLSSTGRIYESNPVTVINDHCLAKWEETIYAMTAKGDTLVVLAIFNDCELVEGDRFGSVGLRLTVDALKRFR